MKRSFKLYLRLFLYSLRLSAFTFGGGFVIVALMKKLYVDKLGWLSEKEMLDYTAIAQSSPGAVAVNVSLLVGYGIGGVLGAAVSVLATVIPPLVILSVISLFYTALRESTIAQNVLLGMQGGVCAVICDVVCGLSASIWKENRLISIAIAVCSFILVALLSVNIIYVIAASALVGILVFGRRGKNHASP